MCACLAADMDTRRDTALMMDIGTNGEIALSAGGSLWACSTAAGPAFEGAGILHGMRAEAGAIWGVTFSGGDFRVEVIGGGPPRGVCGTGLMEAAGALKRAGLMEAGGRLLSPEELSPGPLRDRLLLFHGQRAALLAGDVVLTQGDIRQLQLAKAALRCGAELICKAAGVAPGQVETLLLAGAFGSRLTGSAAEGIGLLPPGLGRRLEPMGNAALDGAKKMLLEDGALPRAEEMAKGARHVELAKMPGFEDTYVDALEF